MKLIAFYFHVVLSTTFILCIFFSKSCLIIQKSHLFILLFYHRNLLKYKGWGKVMQLEGKRLVFCTFMWVFYVRH